jgi:putative tricarboxylic transport membrane protein
LHVEYVAFTARPDAPSAVIGDVVKRVRGDPGAVSFAIAAAPGGANHIASALAVKAAGVDVRRLKFVVFPVLMELGRAK